ncbi:MAG: hypothetical protein KKA60_00925 [Proteobacteria bacterium]|nr:hypothetical protein [Pseudomonadota bacterium]
MSPVPRNLAPRKIRTALVKNSMTQVGIARRLTVSPSMVQKVIDGLAVSHRVRRAVSEATGIPLARLWPSSYAVPGGRRGPGRPRSSRMPPCPVTPPSDRGGAS